MISWTEGAIADLEHIRRYVSAFQPAAAERLAGRIAAAATALGDETPGDGASDGVGERAIVYPYLIRYRRTGGAIVILAVRHSDKAWIR